ncbi:MAG: hypothetical protein JJU24_14025 [Natronohydrobacter sp.]|nr:hypothetical protein [Natronohydrobacter sp.]
MIYRVSFNPKAALVAAGISIFPLVAMAQSEAAPAWGDVTAAAILGDPAWQEYLSSNVRRSNISRWRNYAGAAEANFETQGDWQIARFCAPSGCATERVIMAFAPQSDAIILATSGTEGLAFFGTPKGPLPTEIVDLYQSSVSPTALRAAFEIRPDSQRRALQSEMYLEDLYDSDIADGRYGPKTERGLVAYALLRAPQLGFVPNFSDDRPARNTLEALARSEFIPIDAEPGSYAFEGVWSCDGGTRLTLTSRSHQIGDDRATPLSLVETYANGSTFGLLLSGGARIGIWDVTASSLTWASQASGDMMDCRKSSDAPTPPALPERAALPDLPVAATIAPTAPPQQDATASETPRNEGLPFIGRWTCAGMEFTFAADFGVNHAQSYTQSYQTVTEAETNLWDIAFADGVSVRLGMMNQDRMVMIVTNQVLQCERLAGQ